MSPTLRHGLPAAFLTALVLSIGFGAIAGADSTFPPPVQVGELKQILASDAAEDDSFGNDIATSGDIAVVGARGAGTNGAAYVLYRDAGGTDNWGEVAKIEPSDASTIEGFGQSVALDGDTIVVGAQFDSLSGGTYEGAAYVFERDAGGADNWGEVKKLTASDPEGGSKFAFRVAINGDTVIVGAPDKDEVVQWEGAAYVFERDAGGTNNWGEVKKVVALAPNAYEHFGSDVAVSDDTAFIGAPRNDNQGSETGAVYVLERNLGGANNWGVLKIVYGSDATIQSSFGTSVAVSGGALIVGAPGVGYYKDPEPPTVFHPFAGAAYIFDRDQGGPDHWGEVKKVTPPEPQAYAEFGLSVAIDADYAIVGSYKYDRPTGAAFAHQRDHGGPNFWGRLAELEPSATEPARTSRVPRLSAAQRPLSALLTRTRQTMMAVPPMRLM